MIRNASPQGMVRKPLQITVDRRGSVSLCAPRRRRTERDDLALPAARLGRGSSGIGGGWVVMGVPARIPGRPGTAQAAVKAEPRACRRSQQQEGINMKASKIVMTSAGGRPDRAADRTLAHQIPFQSYGHPAPAAGAGTISTCPVRAATTSATFSTPRHSAARRKRVRRSGPPNAQP